MEVSEDVFKPGFRLSPNPENIAFDFDSKDEHGNVLTCEGKLKEALLRTESSPSIAGAGGAVMGVIGAVGMGKSCAVRKIASLQQVRDTFVDGIYEISLGMDAKASNLMQQVCECVCVTGGKQLFEQLSREDNVQDVLRIAAEWFQHYSTLFIVDDVWITGEISLELLHSLKGLLGTKSSRMVFTSTSSELLKCTQGVIEFESRKAYSNESKRMFLANAGMSESEIELKSNANDLRAVLEVCGGWPVALAAAGQLVRRMACTARDPLRYLLTTMKGEPDLIRRHEVVGYGSLLCRLDDAVEFAERELIGGQWLQRGMSITEIVQSVCVLEKQQFGPVSMLTRLWGAESESSAIALMEILRNVGVLKLEVEKEGKEEVGIIVHDLVHEHFACKAEGKKRAWHEQLLKTYLGEQNALYEGGCRAWWKVDKEGGLYLYKNLFRHLFAIGLMDEATAVLLDPRWTVRQITVGGIEQALDDYVLVTEVLRRKRCEYDEKGRSKISHQIQALELIKEAITLSSSFVRRNRREVWFQLYGRLIGSSKVCGIREYLEKIECHAEKPWIRCGKGCLSQSGGLVKSILNGPEVSKIMDATIASDGCLTMVHAESGQNICATIQKYIADVEHKRTMVWNDVNVDSIILSNDGRKLAMFKSNGSVKVCEVETRRELGCIDNSWGTEGQKWFGFNADGSMLACASDSKTVEIWNVEDARLRRFCSLQHEDEVLFGCWSKDGRWVTVGGDGVWLSVWDAHSGHLQRCFKVDDKIKSVGWTCDGRIAGLCACEERISIWNVESWRTGEAWLQIHGAGGGRLRHFKKSSTCWTKMQWSPDGQYMLLNIFRLGVLLWDIRKAPHVIKVARLKGLAGGETKWCADSSQMLHIGAFSSLKRGMTVMQVSEVEWTQLSAKLEGEQWVVRDWEPLLLEDKGEQWRDVRWSSDGSMLAAAAKNDKLVCLWDSHGKRYADGELRWSDMGRAKGMAWAGERLLLAVACDGGVQVWDAAQRRRVRLCECERLQCGEFMQTVALSADGQVVAALSHDGTLLVWDMRRTGVREARVIARANVEADVSRTPKLMACSRDGSLVARGGFHRSGQRLRGDDGVRYLLEVHHVDGSEQQHCIAELCDAPIRRLWFDHQDKLLIEWHNVGGEARKYSEWHWREKAEAERTAAAVAHCARFRPRLATFEALDATLCFGSYEFDAFNRSSNAYALVHNNNSLSFCYLHSDHI